MKRFFKYLGVVIGMSLSRLNKSNPLILASSTAFFTTFSISPIVILLVNILGIYFQSQEISERLFVILRETFGNRAEKQIEAIVYNLMLIEGKGWILVLDCVILLFVATTLLKVIRQSIHVIWHISSKPENQIRVNVVERSKASALILLIGVLFVASLVIDGSVALLKQYLVELHPSFSILFIQVVNVILSVFLITVWLTILFMLLPDAYVAWEIALAGGFVTSILFNIGKIVLGYFLIRGQMVNIFGASTSFALILLFIFYTSLILYFGASFTYVHGSLRKKPIRPGRYAHQYEEKIISVEEAQ